MFLVGAGVAALMAASLRNANMWAMSPGMDGAMTMGVLGFGLLILHGVRFRRALAHLLPVFGIQAGCAVINPMSGFTLFGLQALVFGLVGLLVAQPQAWARRTAERRRPGQLVKGPLVKRQLGARTAAPQ